MLMIYMLGLCELQKISQN